MTTTIDPFDTLSRAANVLRHSRQLPHLCALKPTQLMALALACVASGWDVTPDQLDEEQVRKILAGEWATPTFDENMRPSGGTPGRLYTQAVDLASCANRLRAAHLHVTSIVKPVPPFFKRAETPLGIISSVIEQLDAMERAS